MEGQWRIRDYFPEISDDALSALRVFHIELLRYNQKLNLISNFTEDNADLLHFYESIKSSQFMMKDNPDMKEIYDFGSGNGFAAIVFAILFPNVKTNIVEGDLRKAEFLKHVIARTQLANTTVLNVKAESLNIPGPGVVMSRALANLARTLLLGSKILEKGSKIYTLKGDEWFGELAALPPQISSTWNTEMVQEYVLPESLGNKVLIRSIKTK